MLDWARTGLWHNGVSRQIYGQDNGFGEIFPMVGQYFDMACCCCNPYVVAVVACPPDSIVSGFDVTVHNRDFRTWVSGGMLYYSDSDLGTTDSDWEECTSIINPDTNTATAGKWIVRRLDLLTSRGWRFDFGSFPASVDPLDQTCMAMIDFAFKDGGVWVSRAIPSWIQDTSYSSNGYFRDYDYVSIPPAGGNAETRTFFAERPLANYSTGGFFYTSP